VKLGGIPCRGSCENPGPFALRLQWPPMKSSGPSIPQPRARLSGTSAWGLSRPGVRVVWPFPPALFELVPQHESHEVPSLFDLPRAKRSGRGDPDLGSFYGDTFGSHSPFEVVVGDGVGATLHVYLTRSTRTSSGRLSWGCPRISPPSTQSTRVHSQAGSREEDPSFGSNQPRSELVPPLPFLPASTVFSARQPAGLLHPAADHGVRHVSGGMLE